MAFNLNLAVDSLLKKEFDIYRDRQEVPPLLLEHGLTMKPFAHTDMDLWRSNFKGISYIHNGLELFGAVDDVWINQDKELVIVDYKATSKRGFNGLEGSSWKEQYKRQLSFYQWLFVKNGFVTSKTGYFVYCNAKSDLEKFDNKLEFETYLIAYNCDTAWIEPTLENLQKCLDGGLPKRGENCDYCKYSFVANENLGFDF